eukprot:TRINITY_DN78881_c0_g1_i1.p1 TRINITY_DN78881_c0_g1~~TRINITY_DN78881_c0_g1_i1.p1  ORF type:complete len:306 (+),score=30.90 TRINITY_DN78881_c0_g1_i1:51-920(+)
MSARYGYPRNTLLTSDASRRQPSKSSKGGIIRCPRCKTDGAAFCEGFAQKVRCRPCNRSYCIDCGAVWDSTHTCNTSNRLRRMMDRMAPEIDDRCDFQENVAVLGFKRCPGCGCGVEKEDPENTCDHMRCANPGCDMEFCWTCLADRRVIKAHGNHFHEPKCKFYFEYDGADEFLPDSCPVCFKTGEKCEHPKARRDRLNAITDRVLEAAQRRHEKEEEARQKHAGRHLNRENERASRSSNSSGYSVSVSGGQSSSSDVGFLGLFVDISDVFGPCKRPAPCGVNSSNVL